MHRKWLDDVERELRKLDGFYSARPRSAAERLSRASSAIGVFEHWIIGGVVVVAGLYALRVLWSEWRGENGADLYQAPDWWPFELALWRALVRSGPVGAVEAPLLGGAYIASGVLEVVLFVGATCSLVLMLVVGLFNRPRLLVAPDLRELPGLIDERKGAPMPPAPPGPARSRAPGTPCDRPTPSARER